ncbi:hypothetical protein CORMATOL_00605 [Corynebacterium matruchotii ATCC 33806]|uniref:Uncharacterized protein n=1 Tax=Corynebacterium matruchotii ATCC 33806 TaxID=566549 RepID=C0E0V5_9CORY|nr:hypothetical protein CORMATOL_00605 [Corynebacterium matruchotii ATCC 33806]
MRAEFPAFINEFLYHGYSGGNYGEWSCHTIIGSRYQITAGKTRR